VTWKQLLGVATVTTQRYDCRCEHVAAT